MDLLFACCIAKILISFVHGVSAASNTSLTLEMGFTATPSLGNATFDPLLSDPTGVFAFGFMRVGPSNLDLAVIHLPSSQPLWRAEPTNPANWAPSTKLSFDGNLVLTDTIGIHKHILWSCNSTGGNTVILRNTSNLQIVTSRNENLHVWQSFDHPFDTLVQDQNFTSANPLTTADKRYTFRIRASYIALYMEFEGNHQELNYWKHTPYDATPAGGPIYGVIDPQGFFGLYMVSDGSRAERIPFDSFQRGYLGFHRLTLQKDGNLYGYYWDNKSWDMVYTAVVEQCGLPGTCGAYGLCIPGKPTCSCLVNGTDGCLQTDSGDFCGKDNNDFSVIRKSGVTVEYTYIMDTVVVGSLTECEKACENNCTCWGALFVNTSKNCYIMDYPIQTIEKSGDTYQGYFKVRANEGSGKSSHSKNGHTTVVVVTVLFTFIFLALAAYGGYRFWDTRRDRLPRVQLGTINK
ncbi:hypothetical protein LUZ60_007425 [Juncus effusus]|nr:hypothetical protein LUZ60_007425 [Juncus effusus]